jgi:hypothetical protein
VRGQLGEEVEDLARLHHVVPGTTESGCCVIAIEDVVRELLTLPATSMSARERARPCSRGQLAPPRFDIGASGELLAEVPGGCADKGDCIAAVD